MNGITEPATLVTDYLLAGFTAVLGWKLWTAGGGPQRWWSLAFAATTVAGVAGGTVHGFRNLMAAPVTDALWVLTLEAVLVAAFAIVVTTMAGPRVTAGARRAAIALAAAAFAVYGAWVAGHPRFVLAIAGYGTALLLLAAVHARDARAGEPRATWLLEGVAFSAAAAVVQQSGMSLVAWFNHNDLYHVIQAVAVWFLYRGAMVTPSPDARATPSHAP